MSSLPSTGIERAEPELGLLLTELEEEELEAEELALELLDVELEAELVLLLLLALTPALETELELAVLAASSVEHAASNATCTNSAALNKILFPNIRYTCSEVVCLNHEPKISGSEVCKIGENGIQIGIRDTKPSAQGAGELVSRG